MKKTIIIVTDLGLLRAYLKTDPDNGRPPSLERIEEWKPERARQKRSEQVSDQAGRFPQGAGAVNISGNLSAGESLNTETEQERRSIVELAGRINTLLADPAVTHCLLAVSAPIHKQVLAALEPAARAKITSVIASNLAKTDPGKLLGYFERHGTL
ncbi:MAG: host attachment protein [Verrucomicrobia bacterium]|nr:host attachment protein [Verrucomicrobiota bacterium]MCH8527465.1 host attachment protein [Kiritimatiellia bacterium]